MQCCPWRETSVGNDVPGGTNKGRQYSTLLKLHEEERTIEDWQSNLEHFMLAIGVGEGVERWEGDGGGREEEGERGREHWEETYL